MATPSPVPTNDGSPILQGGFGPLDRLDGHYLLDNNTTIQVSSRYRPLHTPTNSTPGSSRSRSTPSTSSQANVAPGEWQLILSRISNSGADWYMGQWDTDEIRSIMAKAHLPNVASLERLCVQAWQDSTVTMGAFRKHSLGDGTWSQISLLIGDEGAQQLRLPLKRVQASEALTLATWMSLELVREKRNLRETVETKQAKLEHARKLAGITQPVGPRLDASLTNPGRLKRKVFDDEGFEGDDDDDDEEPGDETLTQDKSVLPSQLQSNDTAAGEAKSRRLQSGFEDEEEEEEEVFVSPATARAAGIPSQPEPTPTPLPVPLPPKLTPGPSAKAKTSSASNRAPRRRASAI